MRTDLRKCKQGDLIAEADAENPSSTANRTIAEDKANKVSEADWLVNGLNNHICDGQCLATCQKCACGVLSTWWSAGEQLWLVRSSYVTSCTWVNRTAASLKSLC